MKTMLILLIAALSFLAIPPVHADVNVYNNINVCAPRGEWVAVINWYYQPGHWETYWVTQCVGTINGRAQYAQVPQRRFFPGYWYWVREYVWVRY